MTPLESNMRHMGLVQCRDDPCRFYLKEDRANGCILGCPVWPLLVRFRLLIVFASYTFSLTADALSSPIVCLPQPVSIMAWATVTDAGTPVSAIARRALATDELDELLLGHALDVNRLCRAGGMGPGWTAPPARTVRNLAPCTRSTQWVMGT